MSTLIDSAELNEYLGRTLPSDRADLLCELASGVVRSWCRWNIDRESVTFTLDGGGAVGIDLPTLYLHSVTSVTVTGTLLTPDQYTWSHNGRLARVGDVWPSGMRNVVVVAEHGFEPIPYGVKAAALSIASGSAENPTNLKSAATGTATRSWQTSPDSPPGLLTVVQQVVLGPYRLPLDP